VIELAPDLWLFPGPSDRDDRDRATRKVIAAKLACAARDIRFEVGITGKPRVVFPSCPLNFSRACRPGGWVLAVSDAKRVGVDLEPLPQDMDWTPIVRHLFSTAEQNWIHGLSPSVRTEGFFRLWTGKEAVLKAEESGIADGVADPDFTDLLGIGPWPDLDSHHLDIKSGHASVQWFKQGSELLVCRAVLN